MAEISIHTGIEHFRGPARKPAPLSVDDMRTLVVLLIVFMGSILVVLLRPLPQGKEVTLPEGASLAEPSRRAFAGLLDLIVAATIAVKAFGISGSDLTSINLWMSMAGIELVIAIFIIGFVLSTMGEAMIGRSLGKLVTGCEVISVLKPSTSLTTPLEHPEHMSFRQVLTRNAIKWLIPPVGLSILIDPTLRHRGDLLASTAVVVWAPREDNDDEME